MGQVAPGPCLRRVGCRFYVGRREVEGTSMKRGATRRAGIVAGALALVMPMAGHAQQAAANSASDDTGPDDHISLRLSTGITASEGHYGDPVSTRVIAAPVAVKVRKGGFSLRVSVPYVHIDGPRSLIDTPQGRDAGLGGEDGGSSGASGGGGSDDGAAASCSGGSTEKIEAESESEGGGSSGGSSGTSSSGSTCTGTTTGTPTGGAAASAAARSRGGLGDVSVALGYDLDLGEDSWLDLGARVKLPTASRTKRLGTGKVDFTLGADIGHDFGPASVYVGARRRFLGKPAGSTLRDTWGAGGGVSYRLGGGTIIGADYDWQRSATPGGGPISELSGWVNFGLTSRLRAQVTGGAGLSRNSVKASGGISLSWRID